MTVSYFPVRDRSVAWGAVGECVRREGWWWGGGGCGTRMLMRGTRTEKITLYNANKPSRRAKYQRSATIINAKPPSPKAHGGRERARDRRERGHTAETSRMRMLRSVRQDGAQHQHQRWNRSARSATVMREDAERPGSPHCHIRHRTGVLGLAECET